MSLDPEPRRTVAWLAFVVLAGCPPAVRPEAPGEGPDEAPPARDLGPRKVTPGVGHGALIGEMCPQGAAGRPGMSPLAVRDVSWSSDDEAMESPLARGSAAQFTVLAVDGRRAGVFASIGTADVGGTMVAIGSYAGSPPCSRPTSGTEVAGDATCIAAQRGCGLAIARIGAPGSTFGEGDAPDIPTGGACKSGDTLAIDVDADGTPEMFALGAFVDATRAPAGEVIAAAVVAPPCTPTFSLHKLVPTPMPGVVMDGKHKVELDVLGVVDVDGDGRREVIVAFRYLEGRTIAVYSAMDTAARLELVGESVPWP